jgi:hypothetical protein
LEAEEQGIHQGSNCDRCWAAGARTGWGLQAQRDADGRDRAGSRQGLEDQEVMRCQAVGNRT